MTQSSVDVWRALCKEYEQVILGELWLAEIRDAARACVRSYPPIVYAETGEWTASAIDDVVSDVTTRQLLADSQIHYIVQTARTVADARALLKQNVRWTLARRRQRTVVDNLLDRCRELRVVGAGSPTRTPTDEELGDAVARVRQVPRLRVLGRDRAPVIFSTPALGQVLDLVTQALPAGYGDRELAIIFERVLTPHLPSALVIYDGHYDEPDTTLRAEELLMVQQTASEMYDALSPQQRVLMALKLANASDNEVGEHLKLSRPTVANRKKAASERLNGMIIDVPSYLHDAVLVKLTQLLSAHVPGEFAAYYPAMASPDLS